MEIESQATCEVGEAFLLGLQRIMVENIPPLEGDDDDEEEDACANYLKQLKQSLGICRKLLGNAKVAGKEDERSRRKVSESQR